MFVVSTNVRPPAARKACASRTARASSPSIRPLKRTPSRARWRCSRVSGCPHSATCVAGVPGPGPRDPPPKKRCSCMRVTPRLCGSTGPVTVIAAPGASYGMVMAPFLCGCSYAGRTSIIPTPSLRHATAGRNMEGPERAIRECQTCSGALPPERVWGLAPAPRTASSAASPPPVGCTRRPGARTRGGWPRAPEASAPRSRAAAGRARTRPSPCPPPR